MKKKRRKLKGAALAQVVFVLFFITTIMGIIFSMVSFNLKGSVQQQGSTQAYYLTLSGIDIATSALLQEKPGEDKLIDVMALPVNSGEVLNQIIMVDSSRNAQVEIWVKAIDYKNGKWIEIKALGSMLAANNDYVTNSGRCLINVANPNMVEWEVNKTT